MQEKLPKVTVVTVVYNLIKAGRKETFLRCVESVKNQTYKNIEHIIIDGASDDGTLELIESTGLQCYSEPDEGIYDAMNKGIEKANGEYVNFLNSDDCFCDVEAISASVAAIEKVGADWSYADAYYSDDGKKYVWEGSLKSIPFGCFPCHQTLFVRKNVLQNLGGFELNFPQNADNILMMKLDVNNYKSVKVEKKIIDFMAGGVSSANNNEIYEHHARCFYNIYKNLLELNEQDFEILRDFVGIDKVPEGIIEDFLSRLSRHSWVETFRNKSFSLIPLPAPSPVGFSAGVSEKSSRKVKYYILGMPVFEVKRKKGKIKYSMCGVQLLKIKKSANFKRIYLFGLIQMFKCEKKCNKRKVTLFGFIKFEYSKK